MYILKIRTTTFEYDPNLTGNLGIFEQAPVDAEGNFCGAAQRAEIPIENVINFALHVKAMELLRELPKIIDKGGFELATKQMTLVSELLKLSTNTKDISDVSLHYSPDIISDLQVMFAHNVPTTAEVSDNSLVKCRLLPVSRSEVIQFMVDAKDYQASLRKIAESYGGSTKLSLLIERELGYIVNSFGNYVGPNSYQYKDLASAAKCEIHNSDVHQIMLQRAQAIYSNAKLVLPEGDDASWVLSWTYSDKTEGTLVFNNEFFRKCAPIIPLLKKYGDTVIAQINGDTIERMSASEFINFINSELCIVYTDEFGRKML